jgi:manganese/zinc/iron transport system permease protein
MFLGTERGLLIRYIRQVRMKRNIGRQHLLRALYEILESDTSSGTKAEDGVRSRPVPFRQIRGRRTWTDRQLRKYVRDAYHMGLLDPVQSEDSIMLTDTGLEAAALTTRNHRLWELYLIEYADVATSRVDRDADAVEHVLGEKMVARLEAKLQTYRNAQGLLVPESPHPISQWD